MRLDTVVVGVDFSSASLAAARWVAAEVAPRAEVVLVHVLRVPEAPPFLRPHLAPMLEVVADVAPALRGGLRSLARLIDPERVRIEMHAGAPAEALARAAATAGADLVCVGRMPGRRGGARHGASTAHRLLARTSAPVLVVPAGARGRPERVLAAVGDDPRAGAVLRAAAPLARAWEARVDALHVLAPELRALAHASRPADDAPGATRRLARLGGGDVVPLVLDEAQLERRTSEWLESLLDGAGVAHATGAAHVRTGDPGQEVVALAHAGRHDLIVVGRGGERACACACSRGATEGAERGALPVGSGTRLVVAAAPCPVLVLPPAACTEPADAHDRHHASPAAGARHPRRFLQNPLTTEIARS